MPQKQGIDLVVDGRGHYVSVKEARLSIRPYGGEAQTYRLGTNSINQLIIKQGNAITTEALILLSEFGANITLQTEYNKVRNYGPSPRA